MSPCQRCGEPTACTPSICAECWTEHIQHRKTKAARRWTALTGRLDHTGETP